MKFCTHVARQPLEPYRILKSSVKGQGHMGFLVFSVCVVLRIGGDYRGDGGRPPPKKKIVWETQTQASASNCYQYHTTSELIFLLSDTFLAYSKMLTLYEELNGLLYYQNSIFFQLRGGGFAP